MSSGSESSSPSFSTARTRANASPAQPSGRLGPVKSSGRTAKDEEIPNKMFESISLKDDDDDDVEKEDDSEDEAKKTEKEKKSAESPPEDISKGWDKINPDEDVNYEHIPQDMLDYLRDRRNAEHVGFDDDELARISNDGINPDPDNRENWIITGEGPRHQESYAFERDFPDLAPLIRRVVDNPASRPAREALLTALGRARDLRRSAEDKVAPAVDLVWAIGQGLKQIAAETKSVLDSEYLTDLSVRIQESAFWRR